MPPALKNRTKSMDKLSIKTANEQTKASSSKPSGTASAVSSDPLGAYNPILVTFHSQDVPRDAPPLPSNDGGRLVNIDDPDEHSTSSRVTGSEYDSVSNNGSCSGDSEDPKERSTNSGRLEAESGLNNNNNNKREKIRLRNEKKHQRQREKRAKELRERCSGFLMSRKLESLTQQLVSMGFSHERATLALMLNEGKVEESINWLFEVGEEEASRNKNAKLGSSGKLKIDISDELARVSEMEGRYKCSRQEVERVVVSCEGDLSRVEETLQAQKRETPATQQTQEASPIDAQNLKIQQEGPAVATSIPVMQTRSKQDFNDAKLASAGSTYSEPGNINLQSLNQAKLLTRDKRWPETMSAVAPPMQQAKLMPGQVNVRQVVGNEGKNTRMFMREMHHPECTNALQSHVSNVRTAPSVTAGYSSSVPGVENVQLRWNLLQNQSTGSFGHPNDGSEQSYHAAPFREVKETSFVSGNLAALTSSGFGSSPNMVTRFSPSLVPYEPLGSYSMSRPALRSLAAPSSLGLFTGWGSTGPESSSFYGDWNTCGLMPELDYTNVDWTLNSNALSSKSRGLWVGSSTLLRNNHSSGTSITNGLCNPGWRDGSDKEVPASASGWEWTSPFAGRDIFSLHRQSVTSPSP